MASSNACIAYDNLFDSAMVTASSQQLLAPATNLQVAHIAKRWRSEEANTASVVADFLSSVSIDTLGVFGLTVSSIGTTRLRLSTADSSGLAGDAYDSAAVAVDTNYNQAIALLSAPVTARYLRLDVADSGADFVEAGRILATLRTQFSRNFGWSWQRQRVDRSIQTKTRGGQTLIWRDGSYRTLDVTFNFVDPADTYGIVETIDRLNGIKDDILFVIDPTSTNLARDCIWGLVSTITPVVNPNFDIYSKQYKIEERL